MILLLDTVSQTPSPTPSLKDGLTPDQVSPGFLGFLATFFVVAIMVFLIVDMVRRIRRVRYRAQVAGELPLPVIPEDELSAEVPREVKSAAPPEDKAGKHR
nr:hypothetical protein [Psychromicrobium silvestre]